MIKESNILFTGGSGLLGKEIRQRLPEAFYPSHSEFDIKNLDQMASYIKNKAIKLLVHAAAFTSPPKINEQPLEAIENNIIGTANVTRLCMRNDIKLIYISTDYVFRGDRGNYGEEDPVIPQNKYAWSKLGGECSVLQYDKSLIVRTSFGENVFPYPKAFVDQWTSRLPAREFAEKLVSVILCEEELTGILHVGGTRKTVFQYAKSISPEKEIGELSLDDVAFVAPKDTSLNTSKFNSIFCDTHLEDK